MEVVIEHAGHLVEVLLRLGEDFHVRVERNPIENVLLTGQATLGLPAWSRHRGERPLRSSAISVGPVTAIHRARGGRRKNARRIVADAENGWARRRIVVDFEAQTAASRLNVVIVDLVVDDELIEILLASVYEKSRIERHFVGNAMDVQQLAVERSGSTDHNGSWPARRPGHRRAACRSPFRSSPQSASSPKAYGTTLTGPSWNGQSISCRVASRSPLPLRRRAGSGTATNRSDRSAA